jgi:hypothetical protein
LSIEQKGVAATVRQTNEKPIPPAPPTAAPIKSADDIERQRQRLEAEKAQEKQPPRKWPYMLLGLLVLIGIAGLLALHGRKPQKLPTEQTVQQHDTNVEMSNSKVTSNITLKDISKPPAPVETEIKEPPRTNEKPIAFLAPATKLAWPAGWVQKSIGPVSYAHADYVTNAPQFVLTTASEGIRASGDSFYFVCETNTSAELQASLPPYRSDPPTPSPSACGIMLRDSDSPGSAFLFIGAGWSSGILALRREAKGAFFFRTNAVLLRWPVILKFEKRDNQIVAAYSFDHQTWMSFDGYALPVQKGSLAGFAAWSGNDSNRVTARFVLLPSGESSAKRN